MPNTAGLSLNQDYKSFTVEKPQHHIHCSLDPRRFAILDQKEVTVYTVQMFASCLHPWVLRSSNRGWTWRQGDWECPVIRKTKTRLKPGSWHQRRSNLDGNMWDGRRPRTIPAWPPSRSTVSKFPGFSCGSRWPLKLRSAFPLTNPVLPVKWENKSREGKSSPGWVGCRGVGGFDTASNCGSLCFNTCES